MIEEPFESAAAQRNATSPSPADADNLSGAPGTPAGVELTLDDAPAPRPLVARTSNV